MHFETQEAHADFYSALFLMRNMSRRIKQGKGIGDNAWQNEKKEELKKVLFCYELVHIIYKKQKMIAKACDLIQLKKDPESVAMMRKELKFLAHNIRASNCYIHGPELLLFMKESGLYLSPEESNFVKNAVTESCKRDDIYLHNILAGMSKKNTPEHMFSHGYYRKQYFGLDGKKEVKQ